MPLSQVRGLESRLNDLLAFRIPAQRTPGAITVHGHAAGDGNAETELKGTVRLLARANAIQEILHVSVRRASRAAGHFRSVGGGAVNFLRDIADLAAAGNRSVRAEHVLAGPELVVAGSRKPI